MQSAGTSAATWANQPIRTEGIAGARALEAVGRPKLSHAGEPGRPRPSAQERGKPAHDIGDIRHDSHGRALDLPELAGVDVDMDDPGLRAEIGGPARGPVVEPHPERDEKIALLQHEVGGAGGMHPHHPEEKGMILGQGAQAMQSGRDGNGALLRKGAEPGRGAGADDAGPDKEHGTLRRLDQGRGPRDGLGVRRRRRAGPSGRGEPADVDRLLLHVLGDVHHDGTRPAGSGDAEGFWNHLEQLAGRAQEEVMLGDGDGEAIGVDLLKRVGADHRRRHLSGHRDHGDRIPASHPQLP